MNRKKRTPLTEQELKNIDRLVTIFKTNGYDPVTDSQISLKSLDVTGHKDALDIQNAGFLVPRAMTTIVQEGIEPLLIGTSLLERIEFVPGMQTWFPAVEPLFAQPVADGASPHFYNINIGGGQSFGINVQRHGLGLRIAERFVEESSYPWINYWLRLAGQALARHKEEYIFDFITRLGSLVYDNDPSTRTTGSTLQPKKGITHGRNYKGVFNGSMTVDDIFDLYAEVLMNGFIPDTMLVHPMAWLMWVKDPVMREFAIQAGGGSFFAQWTGNPASPSNTFYNFNGLAQGIGQTGINTNGVQTGGQTATQAGLPQRQNSAFQLPSYLGLPFKILVSPFVNFDPINRVTDIMMFNSRNLGALIVSEDPHVVSWSENLYDIRNMSIEETYGFGIINEGQAIAVAKNIKVRPNEFVLPARSVFNLSEANSTFQADSSVTVFGSTGVVDPNNA